MLAGLTLGAGSMGVLNWDDEAYELAGDGERYGSRISSGPGKLGMPPGGFDRFD